MAASFSMTGCKEIGELEKLEVEWRIADFFSITEDRNYYRYTSPIFSFAKCQWLLRLWPKWRDASEFMTVYVLRNKGGGTSVEYHIGLRKFDGNVQQFVSGTMINETIISEGSPLIKKSELLQRKSEFAPCNILTVTCIIKWINISTDYTQGTLLDPAKPLKLISK